jgi:hypothetical protein
VNYLSPARQRAGLFVLVCKQYRRSAQGWIEVGAGIGPSSLLRVNLLEILRASKSVCATTIGGMARTKTNSVDVASELPARLAGALLRERIVPRFVDSYVVEHGRVGIQVHAAPYKDLLALLHREALIVMVVHALEVATTETPEDPRSRPRPVPRKEAAAFRRKFLAALTRWQKWTVGEALDFQRDLQMYEELIARSTSSRRRKPFEAANHPFVDRCAFLLDASFLEKARLAASRALGELESLSETVTTGVMQGRPIQ